MGLCCPTRLTGSVAPSPTMIMENTDTRPSPTERHRVTILHQVIFEFELRLSGEQVFGLVHQTAGYDRLLLRPVDPGTRAYLPGKYTFCDDEKIIVVPALGDMVHGHHWYRALHVKYVVEPRASGIVPVPLDPARAQSEWDSFLARFRANISQAYATGVYPTLPAGNALVTV